MSQNIVQNMLVEGDSDIHFITHLCIKKGLKPPKDYEVPAIYIANFVIKAGSKDKLKSRLKVLLKNDFNVNNLGVVIDADSQTENATLNTWESIKNILEKAGYTNLPKKPNIKGTIIEQEGKPKIGVWIMPDNISNGYLEDFYAQMIPMNDEFWLQSCEITEGFVKDKTNRFREIALQKAKVHTWMAWQSAPELPLGLSISANAQYLNFDISLVNDFIEWFKNTFELVEK